MIEAMAALLQITWARAVGRKPPLGALRRAAAIVRADYDVYGPPSTDAPPLNPQFTPDELKVIHQRMLRLTVRNARRHVPAYAGLPSERGLTLESFADIPPTTRDQITASPEQYLADNSSISFLQLSSGTTGTARARIYYSPYEIQARALTSAAGLLSRGVVRPGDVVAVFLPLTAQLDLVTMNQVGLLVGASVLSFGVLPPDQAVAILRQQFGTSSADTRPTVLLAETTHAVEMAVRARELGLGRDDFAVRQVMGGGELLARRYREIIQETFGPVEQVYSASEIVPAFANVCPRGHYHPDETAGYFEIIDPETLSPTAGDSTGVLCVTPFYPTREGMPLIRYWTRDLARWVRCGCGLPESAGPFVVLGREPFSTRVGHRIVSQLEIIDAVADVPGAALPIRFGMESSETGTALSLLVADASPDTRARVLQATAHLLPDVKLHLHTDRRFGYYPLRWERHLGSMGEGVTG